MGKVYQVLVVGLKEEKITLDISHSEAEFNAMTVPNFKKKLLEKLPRETDANDLRLLFANVQLEDEKKFSDYQIKEKSTILLVLRLPGGMEQ
ncbi:uncharacterized protein LOC144491374 [Mustelus asterias]